MVHGGNFNIPMDWGGGGGGGGGGGMNRRIAYLMIHFYIITFIIHL